MHYYYTINYTCIGTSSLNSFIIKVTPTVGTNEGGIPMYAIYGAIGGGLAAVIIAITVMVCCVCCCKYRRKQLTDRNIGKKIYDICVLGYIVMR